MATIVTRSGKGSPLTNNEVDANFTNLNTDKLESGDTAGSLTITTADINGGNIDGTIIGAATPAAGSFTTITGSDDLNIDSGTFFVDASTNAVGIGTGSPSVSLDVVGTTTYGLRLRSNSAASNGFNIYNDSVSDLAYLMNYYNGSMIFGVNNTEKMRLTSTGLGIGTTSPSGNLEIATSAADTGVDLVLDGNKTSNGGIGSIIFNNNGDSVGMIRSNRASANDAADMLFYTQATGGANTERMRIDSNGNTLLQTGGAALQWQNGYQTITGDAASNNLTYRTYANHIWKTTTGASSTTDGTERMRIDSSGRLLVGTASNFQGEALQVDANSVGSTVYTAYISNTNTSTSAYNVMRWAQGAAGSATGMIGTGGSATGNAAFRNSFVVGTQSSSPLVFATADAERARIDSSGNVGIGTTSPSNTLHVQKDTGATPTVYINNSGGDAGDGVALKVQASQRGTGIGDASIFSVHNNASEIFTVRNDGNLGIGTTSPARQLHVKAASGFGYARVEGASGGYGGLLELVSNSVGSGTDAAGVVNFYMTTGNHIGALRVQRQSGAANSGDMLFYTANAGSLSERARIDSNGNLGLGVTPSDTIGYGRTFDIGSTSGAVIYLRDTNAPTTQYGFIAYDGNDNGLKFQNQNSGGFIRFATNNSERARIDSSGNLLVGTTSNTENAKLFVSYPYSASGGSAVIGTEVDNTASIRAISFRNPNGLVGTISTSGSATAYNTSSDYRLKDVDGPITNSGAYIDALKPVQGSWKADGSRFIGLIAHEVQEVSETQIATGEKDGEEMQGMDYSSPELIANLIAEIQSLRARVAQLEGV